MPPRFELGSEEISAEGAQDGGHVLSKWVFEQMLEGVTKPNPLTKTWTYTPREWTWRDGVRLRMDTVRYRLTGALRVLRGSAYASDYDARDD